MSNFYKDMPDDFKNAVNVIKKYCQNEDCQEECKDCSLPLSEIRCGDTYSYEKTIKQENCRVLANDKFEKCKIRDCMNCEEFDF